MIMWVQRTITLRPRPRGFHLITDDVLAQLPELRSVRVGLLHVFIQHTSASLTLNENASPEVRADFERHERVPVGVPSDTSAGRCPTARPILHTRWKVPTTCPRTSRHRCWGAVCCCRCVTDGWRWAPGRGSTCASTATTAALAVWC